MKVPLAMDSLDGHIEAESFTPPPSELVVVNGKLLLKLYKRASGFWDRMRTLSITSTRISGVLPHPRILPIDGFTTSVKAAIKSASRRAGIRASDVAAIVEADNPETTLLRKDIFNARSLINRKKLNGYTPTAALIKLFDEKRIPYVVK